MSEKIKAIFYAYSSNALDHLAPYAVMCRHKNIPCELIYGEDFIKFKLTPRNNIIAHSIANKRRRDNQAKRKKEWNDVVRRVRASLNPTPVRTQRIKSTPRRVNTTQTPVNYNKIVKEAINESNAVKALLNLNRKSDVNKQKKANSMTEANREKIRKQRREWARKRTASMTEADKEAKRQHKREWYRKRREKNLWSYGII